MLKSRNLATDDASLPAGIERAARATIADEGLKASERFFTFFTDTIRNKNTRFATNSIRQDVQRPRTPKSRASLLESQRITCISCLSPYPRLSIAAYQIQDGDPDGKRQAVPVCDQLAECLGLPAMFRPATRDQVVTACGANACGIWDAGAIPAASTSYANRQLLTGGDPPR